MAFPVSVELSPVAVEVLSFAGCPNRGAAVELVERIARELELPASLELVEVEDLEAAERFRFLGSPSIRVAGGDVEPGADKRRDYALTCRVYRTEEGFRGLPAERWLREALTRARTASA